MTIKTGLSVVVRTDHLRHVNDWHDGEQFCIGREPVTPQGAARARRV